MANQNIGTPRFYINDLTYGIAIGESEVQETDTNPNLEYLSLLSGNPSNTTNINLASGEHLNFRFSRINRDRPTYIAVLGHNLNSQQMGIRHYYWTNPDFYEWNGGHGLTDVINGENAPMVLPDGSTHQPFLQPDYDGFSICEVTASDNDYYGLSNFQFYQKQGQVGEKQLKIGAMYMGQYYDIPHSPELSLTLSHEYDGVEKQETAGGSTLSYANYYKPPDWGDLQAWQLDGWDRKYSGRRVWDLTFNHLSDSDLEPYNYHIDSNSGHSSWKDNWFTNVLHYTNGGQLPFIFCPDPSIPYTTSTWTIPEFAICRFDMKTFKREQVANSIYNIKVKIKESW